MRPTLLNHQKFKRLCAMLRIPKPHAVGYLEMLWNSAYESGEPEIGDSVDVELACEWEGEPGKLTEALMNCGCTGRGGFIDEKDGIYTVHDLYDHCPEYVKKRAQREAARRERGTTISEERAAAGRKGATSRWQTADSCHKNIASGKQAMANGGQLPLKNGKRMTNGTTPAPAPAPAPAPTHTPSNKNPPCIPPKGKRATQMPDDWEPTSGHKQLAVEMAVDLQRELEHFRDYCKANGKTYKDWNAGFRTWIRNAQRFGAGRRPRKTAQQQQHEETMSFLADEWAKAKAEEDSGL